LRNAEIKTVHHTKINALDGAVFPEHGNAWTGKSEQLKVLYILINPTENSAGISYCISCPGRLKKVSLIILQGVAPTCNFKEKGNKKTVPQATSFTKTIQKYLYFT
jgi:hypothetical protein